MLLLYDSSSGGSIHLRLLFYVILNNPISLSCMSLCWISHILYDSQVIRSTPPCCVSRTISTSKLYITKCLDQTSGIDMIRLNIIVLLKTPILFVVFILSYITMFQFKYSLVRLNPNSILLLCSTLLVMVMIQHLYHFV